MKYAASRSLRSAFLFLAGFSLLLGSCGQSNLSSGISIEVYPNEALLGPGPDASCLDRTNYLRQIASNATNPTLSRSVEGKVVGFQNFKLVWNREEILYVQGIRVTVTGQGINNGSYRVTLTATEIENLLARSEGIIEPATSGNPVEINSSDPTRELNPTIKSYAACGLRIGQIPLSNGEETLPFSAVVEIELIGTAENKDGIQSFVRARTRARARFYGT